MDPTVRKVRPGSLGPRADLRSGRISRLGRRPPSSGEGGLLLKEEEKFWMGRTHSGDRLPRLADMMLRQGTAWWHVWLSDDPGAAAPGRTETVYRNARAWTRRH